MKEKINLKEYGIKTLFTQSPNFKATGIFKWTLPALHANVNGKLFRTCPNAGLCSKFCYARNGSYLFPTTVKSHVDKLQFLLDYPDVWQQAINEELKKKRYVGKFIRVHDSGDYFSIDYLLRWISIANDNPQLTFYSYTKEVKMIKDCKHLIPDNFIFIFSFGGKQDELIDRETDRNCDVFGSLDDLLAQGYFCMTGENYNDTLAALHPNNKIGLLPNNIVHYKKKQGNKSFSQWQKGERPD